MSAIVAEGISKHWTTAEGEVRAVDGLTFAFDEGTLNVLLGPSGCGKSTALRIVARLSPPSAGTVEWPAGRVELGFVFQDPTLMPWADVMNNVRLPLKLAHAGEEKTRTAVTQALSRVGLADFAQAYPRELSGGEMQRIRLAGQIGCVRRLRLADGSELRLIAEGALLVS